jgi:hypothetical protein
MIKYDIADNQTLKTKLGSDVASANDMTLGDGNLFDITGVTTINTIATKGIGTIITLQFDGILQLTHSADLFLPTATNVTTAAGDIATFYEYASGDWRCENYTRADGTALVSTGGVAVDTIWDAAGDIVYGTGADTASRLAPGTAGQVLQSGGAAAPTWASRPNKNAVINGNFDVWQRGTSLTLAGMAGHYLADRWKVYQGAASMTMSRQSASLNGSEYSLRIQRDSGETNTSIVYLANVFESRDSMKFRGKHLTFSFWAKKGANFSGASDALTIQVHSGTGTDQDSFAAWTGSVFPISQSITLTTSWQKFEFSTSVVTPDTVNQFNVRFKYTPVGTAGAADWFEIAQVQLEEGTVATDFEYEDFGTTLRKCQRYYEKSYAYGTAFGTATHVGAFTSVGLGGACTIGDYTYNELRFNVSKRAVPTIVFYDAAGTSGKCSLISQNLATTNNIAILNAVSTEIAVVIYAVTTETTQRGILVQYTALAEL